MSVFFCFNAPAPTEIYTLSLHDALPIPPDLVVYFGDLGWRSNGSLGHGRHWTFENDTGPDDANHDRDGICIVSGPGVPAEHRDDLTIYDIAPTLLSLAGLPPEDGMRGRPIGERLAPAPA